MTNEGDLRPLINQTVLITGAARRLGRVMAIAVAKAGGNVIIHYNHSKTQAESLFKEVKLSGSNAWLVEADLSSEGGIQQLCDKSFSLTQVNSLINNASIFQNYNFQETSLTTWHEHLLVNITTPFLLSQYFALQVPSDVAGRIINMVDWRALRPGADHFAYSVTKSALVSMTKSMALHLLQKLPLMQSHWGRFSHLKAKSLNLIFC